MMRTRYWTSKDQFKNTGRQVRGRMRGAHRRGVFSRSTHLERCHFRIPAAAARRATKNQENLCVGTPQAAAAALARYIEFIRGGMNIKGQQRCKTLSLRPLALGRWKWRNIYHYERTRAKGEPRDDPNFSDTIPLMRTTIYIFSRTSARAETNKTNQVCERDFSHR